MDFAVYDRRARRVQLALAVGLAVSSGCWYVAEFHGARLDLPNAPLYAHGLTWVFMALLGLYALMLIGELRRHAASAYASAEKAGLLARRDFLTGVLNRATFLDLLADKVRSAKESVPVALFLIDVDRFKLMNDVFGHAFGDAALKHIGQVLSREIGADKVGRLGGDEFAFLLTGPVSKTTCEAVGERVLKALRQPVTLAGRTTHIDISVGVAWSPEHDVDQLDLTSCADLALYLAKARGRGRVECFDRTLMKQERYRRGIERELRGAILLNALEVHYQPILDTVQTRVHALEALVRWRHPVRGYIPPSEFIPVAEQSSLIEMLGNWIFAAVCREAVRWPHLQVSINVSPAQLRRREFVDMVQDVLAQTGCNPRSIAIEITEGLLMECSAEQMEHLRALRALGMDLWLDDFGAGHSGLSYLREFPIDVIKIDKGFMQNMRCSQEDRLFVATIAQLGHGLDKLVIAEGVEKDEDFVMARAAGCSHVQGFHFARPMPAHEIADYVARQNAEKAA